VTEGKKSCEKKKEEPQPQKSQPSKQAGLFNPHVSDRAIE
jgi:hypothetical protein